MSTKNTTQVVADRVHIFLGDLGFPIHGRMTQCMEEFGWTQSQAGKTLRGEQYPTVEMMIDLSTLRHLNITWLLTGMGSMTFREDSSSEVEHKVWEVVNDVLAEEGMSLGNAKRVSIYQFARRQHERTGDVDKESIRDLILSTLR